MPVLAGLLFPMLALAAVEHVPALPATAPAPAELSGWVRQLAHPKPHTRREAFERLLAWGPLAYHDLRNARRGPSLEAAFLADDLLETMGEVLFVGSKVRLEAEAARVAWDQPFSLTVHVENAGSWPVPVSWAANQPPGAPGDDAAQTGAMLDAADFLEVLGPDGQPVDLRVDPIEPGTALAAAIRLRAGNNPPGHELAPGSTTRLTIPAFNRGWSRYPLLEAGRYSVRFLYQPPWQDEEWVQRGYGAVASEPVFIEVTAGAPPQVRGQDRQAALRGRVQGDRVIVELVSTWDRTLCVNLNLGGLADTHARLVWSLVEPAPPADRDADFELDVTNTGPAFDRGRVRELTAGESIEVANVSRAALLEACRAVLGAAHAGQPLRLSARYSQGASTSVLMRALQQRGIRESIPAQLFNGSAELPEDSIVELR